LKKFLRNIFTLGFLEDKKSIDAFMDGLPFDIRAYMKDNLSKEPFKTKAK